jgi:hypothetical protein
MLVWGIKRTKLSIVLGIIATIIIGIGIGNHAAYAAKVTKTSFQDGYNRGIKVVNQI